MILQLLCVAGTGIYIIISHLRAATFFRFIKKAVAVADVWSTSRQTSASASANFVGRLNASWEPKPMRVRAQVKVLVEGRMASILFESIFVSAASRMDLRREREH